jgi:hypothetical protein
VDTEDVGEGPQAKGVDEGDDDVDADSEASHAEVLAEASYCSCRRYQ